MIPVLPKYNELLLPAMRAVESLGGSASIPEIVDTVGLQGGYTDEQWSVLHNNGPDSEIAYRLAWARTYLKGMGLLTNSSRAVWSLTEAGVRMINDPSVNDDARDKRLQAMRLAYYKSKASAKSPQVDGMPKTAPEPELADPEIEAADWKARLIAALTSPEFSPASFERLSQRLLREADFESVTVTGRSGDQGIDGVGVYRLGLLTFPVFFQCKRYSGAVDPHHVRDFRGAMAGRGEKGLLITTGRFTTEARREASRDGATPIELIDGERLCDLLKQYRLGVETRTVERVIVDQRFFDEL